MSISYERAKVFRGGGRRWFTKKAACKAEAREKLRSRCECDRGDDVTPGYQCHYHQEPQYSKIIRRLARIYANESYGKPRWHPVFIAEGNLD